MDGIAPGCRVIALLLSVLRYLRMFFVSTFCPPRMIADDLPTSALFFMTWHIAFFFGADKLLLNFHFFN